MSIGRIYPDYGTAGAPNLDPYYLSPREEKRLEQEDTLKALEHKLEAIREARENVELSDDFCHTNGRIDRYIAAERRLKAEILLLKAELSR